MGKVYAGLDDRLTQFILDQPVYFVATAPSSAGPSAAGPPEGGHVNVSPKGGRGTFAVLGPTTVAYLDLTGSGAETIAHLRQNGRLTIMFCSFTETPKILRLYGTGRVVLPGEPDWQRLAARFPVPPVPVPPGSSDAGTAGWRAIIVAELTRIADSCGYAVPIMDLREERDLLTRWTERKTPAQLAAYRTEHNTVSIDGLPALG
jgi:Pyridoxamine 5'-phosphate oxidase